MSTGGRWLPVKWFAISRLHIFIGRQRMAVENCSCGSTRGTGSVNSTAIEGDRMASPGRSRVYNPVHALRPGKTPVVSPAVRWTVLPLPPAFRFVKFACHEPVHPTATVVVEPSANARRKKGSAPPLSMPSWSRPPADTTETTANVRAGRRSEREPSLEL